MHLNELESIFLEHHRGLFAAALAITRNTAAAEDAVHEALLAVGSLREAPRDMAAYLYRVVRNKALHGIRQGQRQVPMDEDYLETTTGDAEQTLLLQQVKDTMNALSLDERQVLILKLFEGLTFDEIARIMESPPNTVASWYRRGLARLKELLDE